MNAVRCVALRRVALRYGIRCERTFTRATFDVTAIVPVFRACFSKIKEICLKSAITCFVVHHCIHGSNCKRIKSAYTCQKPVHEKAFQWDRLRYKTTVQLQSHGALIPNYRIYIYTRPTAVTVYSRSNYILVSFVYFI